MNRSIPFVVTCSLLLIGAVIVAAHGDEAATRELGAADSATEPATQAAHARRKQFLVEARHELLQNNVESAVALTSDALQLDRDLFGLRDDRVAWRLRDLATYLLELERSDEALRHAQEGAELMRSAHGETAWQVDDADRFVELVGAISTLPRTKRQRFLNAARQVELADERTDLQTALKATQYRAGVLIELFGDRHAAVAKELVRLQDLLIQLRATQTVESQLYRLEKTYPQIVRLPHPDVGRLFLARALLAESQEDNAAAERHYRRAIDVFSAAGQSFDVDYSIAHNNYAVLLEQTGRPDDAMVHYRTASELWSAEFDTSCWTFRKLQNNLVLLVESAAGDAVRGRRWDEAESRYREALALVSAAWGNGDYRAREYEFDLERVERLRKMSDAQLADLEQSVQLLAESKAEHETGTNERALALGRRHRDIVVRLFDEESLDAARAEYWVSWLNPSTEEALPSYAELADAFQRLLGSDHPEYAAILYEQARLSTGEEATQMERAKRAVAIYAESLGEDSWEYADAAAFYGRLLRQANDPRAETVLLEAKMRRQAKEDIAGSQYVDILFDLASWYAAQERPLTALPFASQAVEVARSIPDYDASELSTLVNELANVYYSMSQNDRALELYVEAIDLERSAADHTECDFRTLLRNAAELYFEQEDYDSAERYYRELFDACMSDSLDCDDSCLDGALSLAATHRRQGKYDDADHALARLAEVLEKETSLASSVVYEYRAKLEIHRAAVARDRGDAASAQAILTQLWDRLAAERARKGDAALAQPKGKRALPEMAPRAWSSLLSEMRDMADSLEADDVGVSLRKSYVEALRRHQENRPWLLAEAQCDLVEAERRRELAESDRQRLLEADDLWNQALEIGNADFPRRGLPLMERAASIRSDVLGRMHRQVATSLLEWAWREVDSGKTERAFALYEEGVGIRERLLGADHPETASAQRDAAISARRTSRFEKAENWLQQALATQSRAFGPDHVELADTYHGLAILYLSMGRFASALPVALEASRRYELRDGDQSFNHANALRTLHAVYDELGEIERASEVLIESHQIIKNLYQPSDPEYLDSIHAGAAFAGRFTASFELAAQLYAQLFAGLTEAKLERTDRYADALNMYGNLCTYREDFALAREKYQEALALRKAIYDQPDHPLIAQLHGQLGSTALRLGDLAAAEASLETACDLRRRRLGERSHENMNSLYQLARVKAMQGDAAAAFPLLAECFEIEQLSLDENFLLGSEGAIAEELDDNDQKFSLLLTLQMHASASPDKNESALAWTLGRKGLALDMACRLQTAKRSLVHQPEIVQALAEIQSLRESLAETAISDDDGGREPNNRSDARKIAMKRIGQLQEQLAFRVRDAGVETGSSRVDIAQLRARLPPQSALVEFVVTKLADLASLRGDWTPEHVVAFFLAADPDVPCRLVDLGRADEITELVDALRTQIERLPRAIRFNSTEELEKKFFSTSEALYRRLFEPFASELAKLKYVVVAPDGDLHRVPFAALSPRQGRYLIEDVELSYVSSGRDLLRDHGRTGEGSLLLADPDYDATRSLRVALAARFDAREPSDVEGAPSLNSLLATRGGDGGELRSLHWRPLTGARQEALEVERLLDDSEYGPVRSFVGAMAVEEVLKAAVSPRLLHIATHGFYVPYEAADAGDSSQHGSGSGAGLIRLRGDENPLLRSGVVLAGANQLGSSGDAEPQVDDGWVTAQEIASLDLRNTELVVLSACESGLGDAKLAHGVHGLRRALVIAGAHNVMTSLFEVPDAETRDLMRLFYEAQVASGHPATALRSAQRAMIERLRAAEHAAHPFYWASFFMIGAF